MTRLDQSRHCTVLGNHSFTIFAGLGFAGHYRRICLLRHFARNHGLRTLIDTSIHEGQNLFLAGSSWQCQKLENHHEKPTAQL